MQWECFRIGKNDRLISGVSKNKPDIAHRANIAADK
jgi:hypothetical protein